MNRVSLVGVATGNLIDIISSVIVAFVATFLIALVHTLNYRQPIDPSVLGQSGMFLAVTGILGSLCSILAGYVSARLARHDEVLNGALSSVLCIGLATYTISSGAVTHHMGVHVAFLPLSLMLSAFGGYLRFRQQS
jgi:hypothetical protein